MDWKSIARRCIPSLTASLKRKGDSGRIMVIGGSFEYSGAPYFSGISSLKTGADLVTVVCSTDAAVPIKSYSPELMVAPILPSFLEEESQPLLDLVKKALRRLLPVISRADTVIIGPGLGRSSAAVLIAAHVITHMRRAATKNGQCLILDADALFLVASCPSLLTCTCHLKGKDTTTSGSSSNTSVSSSSSLPSINATTSSPVICLTPNHVELARLQNAVRRTTQHALVEEEIGSATASSNSASPRPLSSISSALNAEALEPFRELFSASVVHGGEFIKTIDCSCTTSADFFPRPPPPSSVASPSSVEFSDSLLSESLGGALLLLKGPQDRVVCGGTTLSLDSAAVSSPRRCGGQGDVLTGVLATFFAWTRAACGEGGHLSGAPHTERIEAFAAAAAAASQVVRTAAALSYAKKGRSMLASDVIEELRSGFLHHFPEG